MPGQQLRQPSRRKERHPSEGPRGKLLRSRLQAAEWSSCTGRKEKAATNTGNAQVKEGKLSVLDKMLCECQNHRQECLLLQLGHAVYQREHSPK